MSAAGKNIGEAEAQGVHPPEVRGAEAIRITVALVVEEFCVLIADVAAVTVFILTYILSEH